MQTAKVGFLQYVHTGVSILKFSYQGISVLNPGGEIEYIVVVPDKIAKQQLFIYSASVFF